MSKPSKGKSKSKGKGKSKSKGTRAERVETMRRQFLKAFEKSPEIQAMKKRQAQEQAEQAQAAIANGYQAKPSKP